MELAAWLNASNICVDYLVFTGDIIDAPVVQAECVKKIKKEHPNKLRDLKPGDDSDAVLSFIRTAGEPFIHLYDTQLQDTMTAQMQEAGKLFRSFIQQIGVDYQNVILCCGNHDRMRLAGESAFQCTGKQTFDESSMDIPFEAYNKFCGIINDKISHHTMVYPRGDLNFVIVNSNWKAPTGKETNNMCISCQSLSTQLSKLKLQKATVNLLIAHKPYDDFCESTKYPYAGEDLTVREIVSKTITAFLYGDKHSYGVRMKNQPKEFMCGLPLCSTGVRYNLLELEPAVGVKSCSYILNDGNTWVKVPITDCMETIYSKSRSNLKSYAFTLLARNNVVPEGWDSVAKIMGAASENGIFCKISNLFAAFSSLRQNNDEIEIKDDSIFDQFLSLVGESPMQSIGIKGRPGVGKSTFLTLVYLHALWMLSNGRSKYIPAYFSMDVILSAITKNDELSFDVNEYVVHAAKKFSEYLNDCIALSKQFNLPLCLFIDGLEKNQLLSPNSNTLEKKIYQLVETTLNRSRDKYVMCFNTNDTYRFDQSFENINRFKFVMFMNQIRIFPYKPQEKKLDALLRNYFLLQGKEATDTLIETAKSSLLKFHRPSIDMFFLHHYGKHILEVNESEKTWDVLKAHVNDLANLASSKFEWRLDMDVAIETAGLLFSQRRRYSEIVELCAGEKPQIAEFLLIFNTPDIANYLIARHYIGALTKYGDCSDEIPKDSILFSFIPNDIALIIRQLLDDKGAAANEILARFIDCQSDGLDGYLYSMIVYLCGHLRTGVGSNLISKLPPPDQEKDNFFTLCNRRSYGLAKAVCSSETHPAQEIILELLDSENFRKFNRSYQIHYYQDVSSNAINNRLPWDLDQAPLKGFDFRYSFLILLSKLDPALKESKPYPLMELDLFTLCDLVYSRLQHTASDSLFYCAKYNEKDDSECGAVLSRTCELLSAYSVHFGKKNGKGDRITSYFDFMRTRLEDIKKKVAGNIGRDVSTPYVSVCSDFEQVLKLSALARVGWDINAPGTIKVENQPSQAIDENIKDGLPTHESLMEYIMESVYIALLFLPDSLSEKGFQKSKVISLLLLSELGKIRSGDYSPCYSNQHKLHADEIKGLADVLTLGALDGYATQSVFFSSLFDVATDDINMRICRDIKMIQTEYKYYSLYQQLGFDQARRTEFESDFEAPTTNICRKIREQLILSNPNFKAYFS